MKPKTSLEKGINVLDTDEDIQEFTIEQYECSKKAIIVALADQKAKILTILVDVLNYEAVTKQEKEIVCIIEEKIKKEFEELK